MIVSIFIFISKKHNQDKENRNYKKNIEIPKEIVVFLLKELM